MGFDRVDVRHFAHVKPKSLQDNLGVGHQGAGAKLGTRVVPSLKDADARYQIRGKLRKMQGSREARGSTAED